MKVAILTIPAQRHRLFGLFGHFQTIGFPVFASMHLFDIYNGFDCNDYETVADVYRAMIADGHTKYKGYEDHPIEWLSNDVHYLVPEWGMLNILRKVASGDEPVLVIENDAYFIDITYAEIEKRWSDLENAVGFDSINVAMFTVIRPGLDERIANAPLEDIDGFWAKGACGPGQTANIYTPQGADWIVKNKKPLPIIESFLYESQADTPNVYSTWRGIIDLHLFCNFDSPHVCYGRSAEDIWSFFDGGNL